MKKYLRDMFQLDENQWQREFEMEHKSAPYQTFVLQVLNNTKVSYVNVNAGYKVNAPVSITLQSFIIILPLFIVPSYCEFYFIFVL